MKVKRLIINRNMAAYLKLIMKFIPSFKKFELVEVPRAENDHVDALSKLASNKDSKLFIVVPIENLHRPSTSKGEEVMWVKDTPHDCSLSWNFSRIKHYLSTMSRCRSSEEELHILFFRMTCFTNEVSPYPFFDA